MIKTIQIVSDEANHAKCLKHLYDELLKSNSEAKSLYFSTHKTTNKQLYPENILSVKSMQE